MGRGVSSGGGQSSLGYLFGSGESPKSSTVAKAGESAAAPQDVKPATSKEPSPKPNAIPPQPVDASKQIAAGIHSNTTNNYFNGQNTCNFIS
ncbi:hypothetical protein M569_16887, partial [Genlisea aurea]